jgi:RNA polymerase sigma-70 factor (ECF subfamily)
MEPTDNELMLAARHGDSEKFGLLFDRYHQILFNFFYRLSGDATSSEDLVQDVFLRMLRYRRSFRADSQFKPWMYQIARSARIDRFRKQGETNHLSLEPEAIASPVRQERPDCRLEEAEQAALVQRALMRLPEEKRELLVLARFQELGYAEIGALLGVETGTIKTRVHRALSELRDIALTLTGERKAPQDVR